MISLEQHRACVGQFNTNLTKSKIKHGGGPYDFSFIFQLIFNILLPMLPLLCYIYDEGGLSNDFFTDGITLSIQGAHSGVKMAWNSITPGLEEQSFGLVGLQLVTALMASKYNKPIVSGLSQWPNCWLALQAMATIQRWFLNNIRLGTFPWQKFVTILAQVNYKIMRDAVGNMKTYTNVMEKEYPTWIGILLLIFVGFRAHARGSLSFEKAVKVVLATLISFSYTCFLSVSWPTGALMKLAHTPTTAVFFYPRRNTHQIMVL